MAERRMAEIVGQRQRLGEIFVEPQPARQRAGDLGDFERMGQPGAVMVAFVEHEDLRLVLEPPERGRMDDAVAVAAKGAAALAGGLGMEPAAALLRIARVKRTGHRSFHRLGPARPATGVGQLTLAVAALNYPAQERCNRRDLPRRRRQ